MSLRPALFTLVGLLAGQALAADFVVVVSGVRIAVYDRADDFRKEARALARQAVAAAEGQVETRFRGLTPGRYAVIAYHDEDGDGRLNLRFGMIPSEGYGLSKAPEIIGPPRFQDAAFGLREPAGKIEVRLVY